MVSEILQRIKNENIKNGTPLEIILFKDAIYDDGGPSSDSSIRRYDLPLTLNISKKEGEKVLGYLINSFKNGEPKGILLQDNLGELFIDERVIQSYTKLKKEEYF